MHIKQFRIIKSCVAIAIIILLTCNNFAAIVSDNDGSAFVTKAEFDTLKTSFDNQINDYNHSIDGKIDGAIASYLSGMKMKTASVLPFLCKDMDWCFRPLSKYYDQSPKDDASFSAGWGGGISAWYKDNGADITFNSNRTNPPYGSPNHYFIMNENLINGKYDLLGTSQMEVDCRQYGYISYGTGANIGDRTKINSVTFFSITAGADASTAAMKVSGNYDSKIANVSWRWNENGKKIKYFNDGASFKDATDVYFKVIKDSAKTLGKGYSLGAKTPTAGNTTVFPNNKATVYIIVPNSASSINSWNDCTTTTLNAACNGASLTTGMPVFKTEKKGIVTLSFMITSESSGGTSNAIISFMDTLNSYEGTFPQSLHDEITFLDASSETNCVWDNANKNYKVKCGETINIKIEAEKEKTYFVMCRDADHTTDADRVAVKFDVIGDIIEQIDN